MREVLKTFWDALTTLNEKEYMKSVIAYNCAPTLKGLKAASTVTLCECDRNMKNNWRLYKEEILKELGIKSIELRETKDYISILLYDESLLYNKLKKEEIACFLSDYGYKPGSSLAQYLCILKRRYETMNCPHELGIFLDFPLKDVKTFIDNPNEPYLLCGYWKVYHNKTSALEVFKSFDKAKLEIIRRVFRDNFLLEETLLT